MRGIVKFGNSFIFNCSIQLRNRSTASNAPLKTPKLKQVSLGGWLLLVIPATTFSLGVWQVYRKQWKEGLLEELQTKTNADPIKLPDSIEEISKLEYRPVHVKGRFLNDQEMYLGPRSLLTSGDGTTNSSLVSSRNINPGYLVITPFKLEDREETILVNRGWVPAQYKNPQSRQGGQIEGPTDVVGIVRLNENRPNFGLKNKQGSNLYFYRDIPNMATAANTTEIYLDATKDFDKPGGPIGGQTMVSLRNEHLSYILTWFSLSGATSYMWYKMCLK